MSALNYDLISTAEDHLSSCLTQLSRSLFLAKGFNMSSAMGSRLQLNYTQDKLKGNIGRKIFFMGGKNGI